MNSGQKAIISGNALENYIEQILIQNQYIQSKNHNLLNENFNTSDKKYIKQYKGGTTIYNTKRRCDFLIINSSSFQNGLIIECKWQSSSGSIDEKYPFLINNIEKLKIPTLIILDGNGYSKGAVSWLKSQSKICKYLLGVYSKLEFQQLVNNNYLL